MRGLDRESETDEESAGQRSKKSLCVCACVQVERGCVPRPLASGLPSLIKRVTKYTLGQYGLSDRLTLLCVCVCFMLGTLHLPRQIQTIIFIQKSTAKRTKVKGHSMIIYDDKYGCFSATRWHQRAVQWWMVLNLSLIHKLFFCFVFLQGLYDVKLASWHQTFTSLL